MNKGTSIVVRRSELKGAHVGVRLSRAAAENLEKVRALLTSEHLGAPNTTQVIEAALKIAAETLGRRAA